MSGGSGIDVSGNLTSTTTVSHTDTSSQGSVDNSGNTVIQDVTLDTFGHITGLVSTTISTTPGTVSQSALKTTTETHAITPAPTSVIVTLASQYAFSPDTKHDTGADNSFSVHPGTLNFAGNTQVRTLSTSFVQSQHLTTASGTYSVRWRYVQASPPYNLGHGDCSQFIFLGVRSDGTIISVSTAADPPWAGQGPTDITPDYIDPVTKKSYKHVPKMVKPSRELMLTDPDIRTAYLDSVRNAKNGVDFDLVEIDYAMKNADMALIPHTLAAAINDDGTAYTDVNKILIDPCSAIAGDLYILNEQGEDLVDIIHNYLILDNTPISGMTGPPGIDCHAMSWKPPTGP